MVVFREEPEADEDSRASEELAGEGGHAVREARFDEGATDVAFVGLIGGHAGIAEDEAGPAVRCEVVDELLHPCEVGVARRW